MNDDSIRHLGAHLFGTIDQAVAAAVRFGFTTEIYAAGGWESVLFSPSGDEVADLTSGSTFPQRAKVLPELVELGLPAVESYRWRELADQLAAGPDLTGQMRTVVMRLDHEANNAGRLAGIR